MKNITTHHGKLEVLEKLANSRKGNPRWLLSVGGQVARTPVDSHLGYLIPQISGMNVIMTVGRHYGQVQVHDIKLMEEPSDVKAADNS